MGAYARKRGIEHNPFQAHEPLNPDRATAIAGEYDRMKHAPDDPAVKRSYDAMAQETLDQYRQLKDAGLEFTFNKDGVDPYAASPALGYKDLKDNGRLSIFPTDAGFGSSAFDPKQNPLLAQSGFKFGGQPAMVNDVFRAVHDAYGHFGTGNAFFRAPGEERAWANHSKMYSPDAQGAMTSETRGQNSWVNYGPHGEANRKASGADTVYADQKTGLMPEWTWDKDPHSWAKGGLPAGAIPSPMSPFMPVSPEE